MYQILKEITVWNTDYSVCNHTYLLDGDRIIAYIKDGDDSETVNLIPSRMRIDKRYRKFVPVKNAALQKLIPKQVNTNVRIFKVKSNTKEYIVELKDNTKYSCTCTGFTFRGKCKHITAVAQKQQAVQGGLPSSPVPV